MEEGGYTASVWEPLCEDGHLSPLWKDGHASSLGEEGAEVHDSADPWRQGMGTNHRQEALCQRMNYVGSAMTG